MNNIKDLIVATICEHTILEENEIDMNALIINELGIDSLGFVEIIVALENTLDIEFPDEALLKFDDFTVEDFIKFFTKLTPNKDEGTSDEK